MKNLFLIIGAPGSGKTTDASIIAQQDEKFAHFSTGDLLRAEVTSGSELGNLIDGYPRSVEQMTELDKVLSEQDEISLKGVIEVDVSEDVARARVLGRARGADDNNEVFNNRMKVYLDPIKPIRKFYSEKELLHVVNGERGIDEIVADIKNLLAKLL